MRSWAAANGRSRTGRRGTAVPPPEDRVTPYVTPAAALPTDDDTSPYQLGRAPPPGDKRDPTEAAGRAAAVPRRGWDAYRVRRGARAGASGERGPLVDVPPAETGVPPAGAGSFPSASPLPSAVVAPTAAEELVVATSPANPEAPSEATTPFSGACVPARPVPSSSPLPRDESAMKLGRPRVIQPRRWLLSLWCLKARKAGAHLPWDGCDESSWRDRYT